MLKNEYKKVVNIINRVKNNEFWNKLFKNSLHAIVGEGGASFLNVFVLIVLIKLIGDENYGILALSQSYMLILDTIINMQSWNGVIRYGEQSLKKHCVTDYFKYIKLGTILDISTAILGCIIGYFLANIIGNFFGWSNELILCAKIFSIEIFFHFSGTPTAVLRIENKFNLISIQKILSAFIKLLLLISMFIFKEKIGLIPCVVIYVLSDVLGHLLLTLLSINVLRKKYKLRNIVFSKLPNNSFEFVKFTFWNTLTDITDIPVQNLDVFIVSKLGVDKVAIYKVFKQIISMLSKLTKPIYQAIYPQFAGLIAEKKYKEGYNVVITIRNNILKYATPFSLLVGITSFFWLKITFGVNYASNWYVLLFYLIIHTIALSYTTIHPYFIALGDAFASFRYSLYSNVLYLIIAYLLVSHFGMVGILIGYFVQFMALITLKDIKIKRVINT